MLFKEELYVGKNDIYFDRLVKMLEKNGIKTTLIHSNTSHQADLVRGTAVGRYGMNSHDLVSVFVKKKDYHKAFDILNSINREV